MKTNNKQLSKKENYFLEKFSNKYKDQNSVNSSIKKIDAKIDKKPKYKRIMKVWGEIVQMWNYVKDKDVPWKKKILPLAGLTYFISPVDAIPDITPPPGVGYIDDAAVITFIASTIATELIRYAQEKEKIMTAELTKRTLNKTIIGLSSAIVIAGVTIALKFLHVY